MPLGARGKSIIRRKATFSPATLAEATGNAKCGAERFADTHEADGPAAAHSVVAPLMVVKLLMTLKQSANFVALLRAEFWTPNIKD